MQVNKIYNQDCLELLKSMPSESVDMVFADPPFNLKKKYNSTKDDLEEKKYLEWTNEWLTECVRILKPTGSIFVHNIPKWLVHCTPKLNELAVFKHWISWDAPTAPMGKSLQPSHYGILYFSKTQKNKFYEMRYPHKRCRKKRSCNHLIKDYGGKKDSVHPFGPLVSDVWTDIHRIKHKKFRDAHPCQLPVHLLERLILSTTDEGDIVFDPFMGTATTAMAAKRLGRKYIGSEIDPTYYNICNQKLENENFISKLGEKWVSFYKNEVITIRNEDWSSLKEYFALPEVAKEIDFIKIKLRKE